MKSKNITRRSSAKVLSALMLMVILITTIIYLQIPNLVLARNYVQGIDVSNHNLNIDWQAVNKAGVKFVYIKRSEGTGFTDTVFEDHSIQAESQGILWGGYHYYYFDADPIKQAQNYYNLLPRDTTMLRPALDLELSDSGSLPARDAGTKQLISFVSEFKRLSGFEPVLYTNSSAYKRYISGTELEKLTLWMRATNGKPTVASWTIWQYSDKGRFGSTVGPLDRNAYNGSVSNLEQLLVKIGNTQ